MDLKIFNLINQFAKRWSWLDALGIALAEYLAYGLILILVILIIINYKKYLRMTIEAIVSGAVARLIITQLIRWLYFRSRPFVNYNVNQLIEHSAASFPSGHASFFFAVSTIVYLYNKKTGVFFFLASILMGVARVFVGIHWPSDILGGAIVGILSGYIVYRVSQTLIRE